MKKLGIYLHIPFCKSKCHYCDFCSFPKMGEDDVRTYCRTLQKQIRDQADAFADYKVDTVYFGGGTPTYLPSELLCSLLAEIFACFDVTAEAEITSECNPATVDEAYLTAMRQAGFNRLSIGAQSLHDGELQLLGRAHTAQDFRATVKMARAASFENISADLMYGIPGQTRASFAASLRGICALGVQHVSAYALKIEQGTPFYKMRRTLDLPDEDTVADMYEDCVAILAENGLLRYEISNFARVGYESRHNLKYWEYGEYLGLGAAAHSFIGGRRYCYDDIRAYMQGEPVASYADPDTPTEAQDEYVMVGLRLEKGIDKAAFAARFGRAFDDVYGARLAPYVRAGFVQDGPERCCFTTKGFLVSNTILSDVLDFD